MTKHIVTHAGCSDGMCAAWVLKMKFPDAELHPSRIGDKPPRLTVSDELYIADYSYPRAILEDLADLVESIVVLDHHITAQEDLIGLPYCTFDMSRSGAGLAWDYCYPGQPRPWLVNYVEDNDLWRHSLPGVKAVAAVLRMTPFNVEDYQRLQDRGLDDVVKQGEAILAYESSVIRAARRASIKIKIGGFDNIPCSNCMILQSDVGHMLSAKAPFAVVWYMRDDGKVQLSFRSRVPEGADVSAIAGLYGGGGHKHASGCTLTLAEWAKIVSGS